MKNNEITVGIPRTFLYYKNQIFWSVFFDALGIKTVISPETNRQILADGIRLAVDESCLPAKIFLGAAAWLSDKCDVIFVPRVESYGKNDMVCTKISALRDILKNTFPVNIIDCNTDVNNGMSEYKAYMELGAELGFSRRRTAAAYKRAKSEQKKADVSTFLAARKQLESDKLKLLIVGHGYNVFDKIIGQPVFNYLRRAGAEAIAAADFSAENPARFSSSLSRTLYWTYNKELTGAVKNYGERVDGIIFLTAFPCGPDSLVNELLILKLNHTPILNIVVDELQSETGLVTRLESFLDILSSKREAKSV